MINLPEVPPRKEATMSTENGTTWFNREHFIFIIINKDYCAMRECNTMQYRLSESKL